MNSIPSWLCSIAVSALLAGASLAQDIELNTIQHGLSCRAPGGEAGIANLNFGVGEIASPAQVCHNFAVFDLAGITPGDISAASFVVDVRPASYFSADPAEPYTLFDFGGDPQDLVDLNAGTPEFNDLGTGVVLGQTQISVASNGTQLMIPFTAPGVADLNARAGGLWAFGGKLTDTAGDLSRNEFAFAVSIDRPASEFRLLLTLASACPSPADVTTTGAGPGDPGFGVPDGEITAADIQFYINLFTAQDPAADLTTAGAAVGDPGFGVPDGSIAAADVQFYVNLFVQGCP